MKKELFKYLHLFFISSSTIICASSFAQLPSEKNVGARYTVPNLTEINITGITNLAFAQDAPENAPYIEISGNKNMIKLYRIRMLEEKKGVIAIQALGKDFKDSLDSNLPALVIHTGKNRGKMKLSASSINNNITKIFLNAVYFDTFDYTGNGNSSLYISKLTVKNATFTTSQAKSIGLRYSSADLDIKNIDAEQLTFQLVGASNIELQGKASRVFFTTNYKREKTSADISAENLNVAECHVDLNDESTLKIFASQIIKGTIKDKATLYYEGTPKIEVKKFNKATMNKVEY